MLAPPSKSVAREVEDDIRDFRFHHPNFVPQATNAIRNAFFRCQGRTGRLQDMYNHTLSCGKCNPFVKNLAT